MRRLTLTILYAVAVLVAGGLTKGCRTYRYELTQFHPSRGPLARPPQLASQIRDVSLTTPVGTSISGWYVPSRNGACIIYVHGSPANRLELVPEAMDLAVVGYGALLIDMPGHGSSGGRVTWGRDDQAAVVSAIDYAVSQHDVDGNRVGAFGFSMGSSVVASVAATDPRLKALVLAGAFTNERDQMLYEFRHWGVITQWAAVWAAQEEGLAFDDLRTTEVISRVAPRPILFVSGTEDHSVPPEMVRALYEDASEPKEFYVVPGAGHGRYAKVGGELYLKHVRSFFDHALGVTESGS